MSLEVYKLDLYLYSDPVFPAEYMGADKSLPRPTSLFIMFVGDNVSFDVGIVIYI